MPTTHLQRTAMAAAIAACFPAAALAAGAARVDFATGDVTATSADGRSRPLARGAEINAGDTVSTQQGRAQLRFADGAYMSLQPQTEFKIEQFTYNGKQDGSENIVMNLLKGGMRTITGLIGRTNKQNYKMKTEVATIGIRGTEYSVQYTNSVEVFCANGSINVQNEGGTLTLNGGQGGFVATNTTPPKQTEDRPFLPPQGGVNKQEQEKVSDPKNPEQEQKCQEGCTTDQAIQQALQAPTPTPTQISPLTGTFEGNWAASVYVYDGGSGSDVNRIVTLDSSGVLVSFTDSQGNNSLSSGGTAQSVGNDGIIAWGRWVSGASSGGGFNVLNLSNPSEGPLHYVVGLPVANMPTTGGATYDMLANGFSASCIGSGCTGMTVKSSTLGVSFANSTVSMTMAFTLNGGGVTAGGYQFNQESLGALSGAGKITGVYGQVSGATVGSTMAGAGSGSLSGQGFLSGNGVPRGAMAFSGTVNYCPEGCLGSTSFNGVTAYEKKTTTP